LTLPPPPELADDAIVLVPLGRRDVDDMLELTRDEDVAAYTLVPTHADRVWVRDWIALYERGWHDGTRAGFSIRDAPDRAFLGFAAVVHLELKERQGELGYMLAPAARGRGAAARAVALLTRWCFDVLGLERLELCIDAANEPSARVAERAGYRLEGVLRNVHFKEGRRTDTAIWSRLATDPVGLPPPPGGQ
jgi:RimJ/RimL family protein N-acetyltransferase